MSYFESVKNTAIKENAVILGIETSCDETAASIVKGGREILADCIISSATEHVRFGGVVPEIASRAHTEAIYTVVAQALKDANLTFDDIDAIAVTKGAGLIGALLVGVSFAKALAYALNKPLVPVSHIRGHMSAGYLADKELKPPFICLLASGGHTAIVYVKDFYEMEIVGSTVDDAVGEAFDKTARVLGLSYPGGPNIERLAKQGANTVTLPKMFKGKGGYSFSYSGLKTAIINYVHNKEQKGEEYSKADLACSFQSTALDILIEKSIECAKERKVQTIVVCGGVGANGYLRENLSKKGLENGLKVVLPEKRYCTDNACMIATEGYLQYLQGNFADLTLNASAVVPLK